MVAVENRPAVPVMEPRDYKARPFCIRREVELAKYGVRRMWRRWALKRNRIAKDAVNASDKQ